MNMEILMTDKKLIEELRENAEWAESNEWEAPLCLADELRMAANRIEKLTKKNEKED